MNAKVARVTISLLKLKKAYWRKRAYKAERIIQQMLLEREKK